MKTVTSIDQKISLRDRVSIKLVMMFAGAFLAVLLVMVGWALLSAIGDSRTSAAEEDVQTPVITIDPKIETDLAKAMSFDAIPAETNVQNPFLDRAGIGNVLGTTAGTVGGQTSGATTSTKGGSTGTAGSSSSRTTIDRLDPSVTAVQMPMIDDTKGRWQDWAERANRGESVGPESETLGIDDLVPVGYAGGGDRGVEVILYSRSLCRTFSFPVGTHFFNGSLYQISQSEVVFIYQNGYRTKSYSAADLCTTNTSNGSVASGQ
jgi:hypothetical protein